MLPRRIERVLGRGFAWPAEGVLGRGFACWPAKARLLLYAILICCGYSYGRQITELASDQPADKPRKYLYPMLIFGPNNQMTGFKEMLVLGRLLKRTVVVHDLKISHTLDATAQSHVRNVRHFLEFDELYDYAHTASRRDVITLEERLSSGWSGRLDAVVYFTGHWLPFWAENLSKNVSAANATWLDYGVELIACNEEGLANLTKLIEPYDTVGFIMFKNVVWNAGYGVLQDNGRPSELNICRDEYVRVSSDIAKSAKLKVIAQSFREKHFQEANGRFMAVHIRPYPDTCMALWRRSSPEQGLVPEEANRDCHNPSLMQIFADQTWGAVQRYGVSSTVFVMCHPVIRRLVGEIYSRAGLKTLFYDDIDSLVSGFGFSCPSLLGMVEQEVARQATVFLGTKSSSMSGIVVEERHAVNDPGHLTIFMAGDQNKLQ